ncbi:MAG: hypothetical protein FWD31_02550 [Planctomycetaceae bacterium]|nr:hypothetical protein [Planctomycetaceae bacterium]
MAKVKIKDNAKKVVKQVRLTTEKALNRVGAYGMTVARNSMKPAGKAGSKKGDVSRPGNPPFYHKETQEQARLKKSIFYAVDPITESVTVGPIKDRQGRSKGAKTLEEGGRVTKVIKLSKPRKPPKPPVEGRQRPQGKYAPYRYFYSKKSRKDSLKSQGFQDWFKAKEAERKRERAAAKAVQQEITIQPRPYMAPALIEAMKQLPEIFAQIKK